MSERDVSGLLNELREIDGREQGRRKSLMSRRWFARVLAASVAGGVLGVSVSEARAGELSCGQNTC